MQTKDWWYLMATVVSPFLAAGITAFFTLLWQSRKEKRDAKMSVFSTLMKYRKVPMYLPPAQDWVNACHLIDVVFTNDLKVIEIWRDLLPMWQNETPSPNQGHKLIELLSAMAEALGFKHIRQTDIDKSYFPKALSAPLNQTSEMQAELLRVLKTTNAVVVDRKQTQPELIEPSGKPPARHD